MTSRSETRPLDPIREWTGPDGEEWVGLHPLVQALAEFYTPSEHGLGEFAKASARLKEITRGERRLPDVVASRMLEIDREQQANGCPNENIAGLIVLLQGRWMS